jgi:hypothetical protein
MNIEYLSFDAKRKFGVEIEVNRHISQENLRKYIQQPASITGWGHTNNNSNWVIKTDSSCGNSGKKNDGGGFEVVSPASEGVDHLWSIGTVVKKLKENGAQINDHCGFHCNVEIRDFTEDELAVLLARWVKIEHIIANIAHPRRSIDPTNLYCVLFKDKYKKELLNNQLNKFSFWKLVKPQSLDTTARRTSITIVNYLRSVSHSYEWESFKRYTVELRIPEGSLEYTDILNWTRLFVNFVNHCKQNSIAFPENINTCSLQDALVILGLANSNNVAVLSHGLLSTKLWVLNRILKYGTDENLKKEVSKLLLDITDERLPLQCYDPEVNHEKQIQLKLLKKRKTIKSHPLYKSEVVYYNYDDQ